MQPALRTTVTTLGALGLLCLPSRAQSSPVVLQEGTATYSQVLGGCSSHSPDLAVNGNLVDNGWAIATTCSVPFDSASPQIAVWETAVDVTFSQLDLRLHQNIGGGHLLGRFRVSVTTDDRATFADGLDNGGDVAAAWSVLPDPVIVGPPGMTFTVLPDHSVLAGGSIPSIAVYDVRYFASHVGVTGVRLEVLAHPGLPFDGPGLQPSNGNLVLSELEVGAWCAADADAGTDQAVEEGASAELDGTASVVCDPLEIAWIQLAGPHVVLDVADPLRPRFVAPATTPGGATLTFQLSLGGSVDAVDVVVRNLNQTPVAHAGDDLVVGEASEVTLDGTASYDPDSDPLMWSWSQLAGMPVTLDIADPVRPSFSAPYVGPAGATLVFELRVSDGDLSAYDTVSVQVENVNHVPTADAGPDATREEGALVALVGGASQDPDGDTLSYFWAQVSGPAVSLSDPLQPDPTFVAPAVGLGGAVLEFQLVVSDGLGGVDSDEVAILVVDAAGAPACDHARPSVGELWPPNHRMVEVSILGVTHPANAAVTITVLGVTQDEPTSGIGNGDSSPDAVIQGGTVLLRAERRGTGNGRVYRVYYRASDGVNVCTGYVTVAVPHSRGRNAPAAVDDGQVYDSLTP